ncbi:MAG: hypothetical protein E6657_11740, partial [Acinetobacter sp.]|nr:hypothetical protein [Acinetobacter sp.]
NHHYCGACSDLWRTSRHEPFWPLDLCGEMPTFSLALLPLYQDYGTANQQSLDSLLSYSTLI